MWLALALLPAAVVGLSLASLVVESRSLPGRAGRVVDGGATAAEGPPRRSRECGEAAGQVAQQPDVTYGTAVTLESDLLPASEMLPHQLRGASRAGHRRFARILVFAGGADGSGDNALLQGRRADLQRAAKRLGAEIVAVDSQGLQEAELYHRYFEGPSASTLQAMWSKDTQQFARYTLTMLSFLEQCRTKYCAWADSDIFVHRHPGCNAGWVDKAVRLLEGMPSAAWVSSPLLDRDLPPLECKIETVRRNRLSSRYFVLNREVMLTLLPVKQDCAPDCSTFEDLFILGAAGMYWNCGVHGPWVVHPPDEAGALREVLARCASRGASAAADAAAAGEDAGAGSGGGQDVARGLPILLRRFEETDWDKVPFRLEEGRESLQGDGAGWGCT